MDSVATHPWSQLHLETNTGTSSAEVIKQPGPSTITVSETVPSAVNVQEGEVKMGNVVPKEKGNEKGKARGAGKEMGGDSRAVMRGGKGKGKGRGIEVREEMEVKKSKGEGEGEGEGKEAMEVTAEKGMLKNKGKGRESNKDIGHIRKKGLCLKWI
ncbi:hypothetical protein PAXRUDRAFT_19068 [Paxillus rubicundulus Ve08.2h10]|uniref:Uncharacterized protein n=1 Tax=Paxillus rubicundulus Ve08.2h10 TaxID=930991 RepID=A0A0D0D5L7_9AGAM|nr:hypothetical protein PAXRUDRAFT_19068 [Paxillus rubicundulus Ve08.2h10]